MKIKIQMLLWGVIGCLAIGSAGCGKESEACWTTAAPLETTVAEAKNTETVENTIVETTAMKETEPIVVETNEAIPEEVCGVPLYMDHVVAQAILEENAGHYLGGECQGEGHIILEEVEEDGISTVYVLMMYGEYEFQNVDYFIKTAGTGVIPVVMQFDLRLSSHTPLISFEWPMDGNKYNDSIKKMFPEHLWDRTLSIREEDRSALTEMERSYAVRYLKEIGRDAVVGEYADFEHVLLTDLGVSVEVSNKLGEYEKNMGPYPYWQGSVEKVEDGTRYMYSLFYDEEVNHIVYEKRVFETHETVEKYVFDAATGEKIELCGLPPADAVK